MAVDLRHLELAVPEDLLKREQIATCHDVVAGEGVAHRMPGTYRNVAARSEQEFLDTHHIVGRAHTNLLGSHRNQREHERSRWTAPRHSCRTGTSAGCSGTGRHFPD